MNTNDTTTPEAQPGKPAARRAPRRPSKPDAVLAAAVETARAGLLEVVPGEQIGEYIGAVPEQDRLVTHRFEAKRPGYRGWQWFATLARVPRGKVATVCEVGLLPSADSILAPEWVPWSERIRPEDVASGEPEGGSPDPEKATQHKDTAREEDSAASRGEEDDERDTAPTAADMEDE